MEMVFPPTVMHRILMFMDSTNIHMMKCVSKQWLIFISNNETFWKRKFEFDFGKVGIDEHVLNFEDEYKLERKWHDQVWRRKDVRISDTGVRCLHSCGSHLVTWSHREGLQLWDLDTMKCIKSIKVQHIVDCVAMNEEIIVGGVFHGMLFICNKQSGLITSSWQAHSSCVRSVHIVGDCFVSGGGDWLVKIWNSSNHECVHSIYVLGLWDIHVKERKIFCTSFAGSVHVFDFFGEALFVLNGSQDARCLCANSRHAFVGTADGEIEVWDLNEKKQVQMLVGKAGNRANGAMFSLYCDPRKLVSVSLYGCVKMWSIVDWKPLGEFGFGATCCVHVDKEKIVLGLASGAITVLDFNF